MLVAMSWLSVNPCPAQTTPPAEETEAPELRELPQEPADEAAEASEEPTTPPAGEDEPVPEESSPSDWFSRNGIFIVVMVGIVLMLFLSGRGRRKQEARRKEMLSSLKKGDKITTIGGAVGTVIEVRDNDVTVKVDETNNIRMKFARWAIRGVGETAKSDAEQK